MRTWIHPLTRKHSSYRTRRDVSKHGFRRRAAFEPLEERRLLSVSPEWLGTIDGPFVVMAYMAAHDTGGFSATGRFGGTVDFDPGPGETLLTNPAPPYSGDVDMAVARFTDSGELLWARRIGDDEPTNTQMDTGVATDRLGNTYVLGIFQYSVDLGGQTLTGDYSDGFIAKLDPNGDFLWSQPLRASSSRIVPRDVHGIAVDDRDANPANWSVFVSGLFSGTATLGGQTFRSAKNSYDGFVSKLSSASGAFQWTQVITGSGTQHPFALAIADTGDAGLYVSGAYGTEAKVGSVTVTGGSYFLAKLNPTSGSTVWAKTVAVGYEYGSIAATGNGIVVDGKFSGTLDFDPGVGVANLTSVGSADVAVLKLDANGDYQWARQFGGAGGISTEGLASDAFGSVYVTGAYSGVTNFGSQELTPDGASDGYFVEIASNGDFAGAYSFPSIGRAVGVDSPGNVYVAAQFSGTRLEYFPTGDAAVATGSSSDSAFIKYSQNAPPIDPTPRIDRFFASVQRAIAGDPFTLNVTRVHDPDRRFQTISFYRDNGDGVLEPADDFLVGADANSSGGWSVTASTAGLAAGTYTFFAQGSDIDGVVLAEAAIDVVVIEGEVASYASMNVPQAIPDLTTITSTLTVPDSFSILDLDVALDITHTGDTNLDVYLIAPDGTRVELFTDVGGLGDNFSGTILDDEAPTAIASGAPPFTGRFRPEASLTAFDGKDAAGVWTLEITDDAHKNKGTLNSWSLDFIRQVVPLVLARSLNSEAQAFAVTVSTAINMKPWVASAVSLSSPDGNFFLEAKPANARSLAATASQPQSASLLLAATPSPRLSSKASDSALADLGAGDSADWNDMALAVLGDPGRIPFPFVA